MIKHLSILSLSLILSLFILTECLSQCENNRLEREVWGKISNNHRSNSVFTYGMVSYQSHEDNYYFESPEDSLFYLGYGKAIWAAGRNTSGELLFSGNTFATTVKHDYLPGPLDRTTGQRLDTLCGVYNRVWKISQFEIFRHQTSFQSGTLVLGDIPADILEWPAKGNPYLEDFSPDFDLAPFHDFAEDGIYDPLSGDYPIALEENHDFIPKEFSYIVYNDRALHSATFGSKELGIEFQQINYLVDCVEDTEATYSVFTRIKYKYLGDTPLQELKIALWEDNDLACNQNDYTGCDLELNCSYFYNKDGETFLGECHDPDVPDNNGAIRSTVFFNHDIKTFSNFYLLGVGDTLIPGIDPAGAQEHYDYMNATWRDGTPITTGGIGYNPGSTDTTKIAFPDRPNDTLGWSMQTAQIPEPLDVRALSTLVDETAVMPGKEGIIDFADHFLYDQSRKRLTVFNIWPERINALKEEFEAIKDGSFNCGGGFEICEVDCVWPGDANRDKGVTGKDFLFTGLLAGQNITDGIPRTQNSTEWYGFSADNWGQALYGVNAKNADANGSGNINETDLFFIGENYNLSRDNFSLFEKILELETPNNQLVVDLEVNEIDVNSALLFDRIIETKVTLAGQDSEILNNPIHGISFHMRYDTNMIMPFIRINDDNNSVFQFGFNYLDNQQRDGNNLKGDNKIQVALTNYNGVDLIRGGLLLEQNMHVREDATTSNPDGRDTLVIKFYNVCAVNAAGQEISMSATYDTLVITNMAVDTALLTAIQEQKLDSNAPQMDLYPNPTQAQLTAQFLKARNGTIRIYNYSGQEVGSQRVRQEKHMRIATESLTSGVYHVIFIDEDGHRVVQQFVKI